jgi:hypothetical protein
MPVHSDLTGSDLHEPKGAATANANEVYVANGSGSGVWKKITSDSLDAASLKQRFLTAVLPDVSEASFVLVSIPIACKVVGISYVLGGAITVANSNVSVTRGSGASLGAATLIPYSSSAEGDQFTFTPSANNNFANPPSYIKIASDGGSTTAAPLYITVTLELT